MTVPQQPTTDLTRGRLSRSLRSRLESDVTIPVWLSRCIRFLDRCQQKLPLSRQGKLCLLLALVLLGTGLFRSINLINLLASFMIPLLLHNVWLARRQLRSLSGHRLTEQVFFAQSRTPVTLEVRNNRRKPAHGLKLLQQGQEQFLVNVPGKKAVNVHIPLRFPQRGRQNLGPFEVHCGYPLGLADFHKVLQPAEEIIVLPRLGTLRRGALRRHLQRHSPTMGQARTVPRRHPAAQTDFHGLRVFQPADSPRWIHWRTSARRGELMVKEFEETPTDNLILFFDPYRPAVAAVAEGDKERMGDAESKAPAVDDHLELAISLTATICWEWCRQKGDRIVLVIGGDEPVALGGLTSKELALEMLRHLAVQTGSAGTNVPLLMERLADIELPTASALVVSTHDCGYFDELQQRLHRTIAHVDVSQGEHEDFYDDSIISPS